MQPAFDRSFLIDITANPTNGASASYQLGKHNFSKPVVPVSVHCPADLQDVDRLTFQVSNDDSTFYDIYDDAGGLLSFPITADYVVAIPSEIQVALLGWAYIRLLTRNGSDVAEEPSADITFVVRFAEAEV